jgi:hypothetical protein
MSNNSTKTIRVSIVTPAQAKKIAQVALGILPKPPKFIVFEEGGDMIIARELQNSGASDIVAWEIKNSKDPFISGHPGVVIYSVCFPVNVQCGGIDYILLVPRYLYEMGILESFLSTQECAKAIVVYGATVEMFIKIRGMELPYENTMAHMVSDDCVIITPSADTNGGVK